MKESKDRREILKGMAVVALGGVAGGMVFTKEALAQTLITSTINPKATAVMPDGSIKTRADILTTLGLDPSTAPDAWLTITKCGSNAAALDTATRKSLTTRGIKMDGLMQDGVKQAPAPLKTR